MDHWYHIRITMLHLWSIADCWLLVCWFSNYLKWLLMGWHEPVPTFWYHLRLLFMVLHEPVLLSHLLDSECSQGWPTSAETQQAKPKQKQIETRAMNTQRPRQGLVHGWWSAWWSGPREVKIWGNGSIQYISQSSNPDVRWTRFHWYWLTIIHYTAGGNIKRGQPLLSVFEALLSNINKQWPGLNIKLRNWQSSEFLDSPQAFSAKKIWWY